MGPSEEAEDTTYLEAFDAQIHVYVNSFVQMTHPLRQARIEAADLGRQWRRLSNGKSVIDPESEFYFLEKHHILEHALDSDFVTRFNLAAFSHEIFKPALYLDRIQKGLEGFVWLFFPKSAPSKSDDYKHCLEIFLQLVTIILVLHLSVSSREATAENVQEACNTDTIPQLNRLSKTNLAPVIDLAVQVSTNEKQLLGLYENTLKKIIVQITIRAETLKLPNAMEMVEELLDTRAKTMTKLYNKETGLHKNDIEEIGLMTDEAGHISILQNQVDEAGDTTGMEGCVSESDKENRPCSVEPYRNNYDHNQNHDRRQSQEQDYKHEDRQAHEQGEQEQEQEHDHKQEKDQRQEPEQKQARKQRQTRTERATLVQRATRRKPETPKTNEQPNKTPTTKRKAQSVFVDDADGYITDPSESRNTPTVEDTSGGTSTEASSPTKKRKPDAVTKPKTRKKTRHWTDTEVQRLMELVPRFQYDEDETKRRKRNVKWSKLKEFDRRHGDLLKHRTQVMLKDKYREQTDNGRHRQLVTELTKTRNVATKPQYEFHQPNVNPM
ncbi:hypothetical protein BG011_004164 [Mortierella polycephala]|uniref:Uncharacterized protein n=1 Tax=Mortierella polycephala TaxID=41804 RepID=A0A9P6Q0M5_9FUNG|nr:hypothetical protein BG011_004164 [Mortierella polycephala]